MKPNNADDRNLASKQIELFAHPAHNIVTPYDSLQISFSSSVSKFFSIGRARQSVVYGFNLSTSI